MRFLSALGLTLLFSSLLTVKSHTVTVERPSTLADQRQINVTIYNSNLALIHDRRHIALERGENRIAWPDVSGNLGATASPLEDINEPNAVSLLEQNFNFDLLTPTALLAKAVGSTVVVVHDKPKPGQPAQERAKLLSINDGLVLQYADRIETGLTDSRIVYTSLPPNLRDRPRLVLDVGGKYGRR